MKKISFLSSVFKLDRQITLKFLRVFPLWIQSVVLSLIKRMNFLWIQSAIFFFGLVIFIRWGWKDNRSPNWDEASYLLEGADLRQSMTKGIGNFTSNYFFNDLRSHPPLLPFLSGLILEPDTNFNINSLIFTTLIWVAFVLSTYLVAGFFLTGRDKIFVLIFALFCPIVFSLGHRILADVLLAVFTTITIYFLMKFLNKQENSYLVLAGVFASLSFLTKPTAPIFLAGPFLSILLNGRNKFKVLTSQIFSILIGFTFLGFSWALPNISNLVAYFKNQNIFPKEMYVLVPENAGTIFAVWQYSVKLFSLLGLPVFAFLTGAVVCSLLNLLPIKKKRLVTADFKFDFKWLIILSMIIPALLFFGLSKFWEFRYVVPIFPFIFIITAKFCQRIQSEKIRSALLVPIVLLGALPFTVNTDPQTWSPSFQSAFYGNKAKSWITNSYLSVTRSGLEPQVELDRSLNFLSFLREHYPAGSNNVRVLIPFSHPELNEISLTWANNFFKDRYIFQEISFREIRGAKIVDTKKQDFLGKIQCADLVIMPASLPIDRTSYNDIVDWKNANLAQVNDIANLIKLGNSTLFNASKLRAVATFESIPFVVGRLGFDLDNNAIYNSRYCILFFNDSSTRIAQSWRG